MELLPQGPDFLFNLPSTMSTQLQPLVPALLSNHTGPCPHHSKHWALISSVLPPLCPVTDTGPLPPVLASLSIQLQPLLLDLISHPPSSWSTLWSLSYIYDPPSFCSQCSHQWCLLPSQHVTYLLPQGICTYCPPIHQSLTEPDTPSCHSRFFLIMSSSEPSLQSHSFIYVCLHPVLLF